MILGIEDLQTAITNLDYIEHIKDKNLKELNELKSMKAELDSLQTSLNSQKQEADKVASEAASALAQAQSAREEAQRKAQEQAEKERQQAEAAAAAEVAKAQEQATAENSAAQSSSGISGPRDDGANWSSDKTTFVNEWTVRIDNYLAGSPLAGQGRTFASAAWDYGVDPRWSPAISYTESSKGAVCFRSHNAWGWGSSSWNSWEEAIDAHVRGLARGYGYTISVSAAKKYCPPNWEHWYNVTSAQMNLI